MDQRKWQHDLLFPVGQLHNRERSSKFVSAYLHEIIGTCGDVSVGDGTLVPSPNRYVPNVPKKTGFAGSRFFMFKFTF